MRLKGDIHYKQGMYDKAIHYLNEAAYYAEQNKLFADLGSALALQGDCFRKIHKPELALSMYLKAETFLRDSHNYYYYSSVLLRQVDLMFELGLDDKARKIISQYVNEKP
jgi:tetratricopeptide (TPR) repeat protein